jgi:hypothetical protein
VLRLSVERDRTPLESVGRVLPPVLGPFAAQGRTRAAAFPVHVTGTGRFVLGAGGAFGSIQLLELDVQAGCAVVGEALLMGHSRAVTCMASAGMEEQRFGHEMLLTGSEDCTAMLWRLQRLNATRKRPCVLKRPDRVLLGHPSAMVACAMSHTLDITVTASAHDVLVHSVEQVLLVRRMRMAASQAARGFRFTHCLVNSDGFIVTCMASGGDPTTSTATSTSTAASSRVQVWTVNGSIVSERDVPAPVARLQLLGPSGGVVMVAREDGVVEFFDLMELDVVGSYRLAENAQGQVPRLTCADAGAQAETPVLLACGTEGGSLVVVGLPLIHFFRDLETSEGFAAALVNVPARLVKDTVHLALDTLGKVRGGVAWEEASKGGEQGLTCRGVNLTRYGCLMGGVWLVR